ncbi:MAG: cob(I)yrinic acid a,c-diamide adenosyltransferase [Treponema sp.]|jgi:cob(I)alamin adenosyltransferase|nr:cob(I)yrinic acid a,c-diamide adenosyltransferase [Treponema sp.]
MSICTKTGDDGTTGLGGNRRLPKDHIRIECIGTLDELGAFLGDAKTAMREDTENIIEEVQRELVKLSALLAGAAETETESGGPDEELLDTLIRRLEDTLPPLRIFILPGSSLASAKLHIARTVCRRAERRLVSLNREEGIPPPALRYINRLSDLLFLLARNEDE